MLSMFPLLDPKGAVGLAERGLMIHAIEFMLIAAIPVYFLLFFFAYRYRAGNTKAKYTPNWEHGKLEELAWWVIPLEIVLVLGALTWSSTHELDPSRPLSAALGQPVEVQVVALEWKWLFIYPHEGIATLNYLALPVGRPVQFKVTADAPMNSFWIPELGGQIYAMTGMTTTLHLNATQPGTYAGVSANYSGEGFAKMKFVAQAMPQGEYEAWVERTKNSANILGWGEYRALRAPSTEPTPLFFGLVDQALFERIVMQFSDRPLSTPH